jgi:hypothetical protein
MYDRYVEHPVVAYAEIVEFVANVFIIVFCHEVICPSMMFQRFKFLKWTEVQTYSISLKLSKPCFCIVEFCVAHCKTISGTSCIIRSMEGASSWQENRQSAYGNYRQQEQRSLTRQLSRQRVKGIG